MHLITTADDELYGLASAAGKLGRAAKLVDRLAAARRVEPADSADPADPADAEAAARYALALMAVLPSVGIEFAAHARFTAAVAALGDVLSLDPDHWLARYSRARLRALIPSSYGAYAVRMSGDLESAREDLDHLLARQATLPPQPYFISTHALATVVDQLAGDSAAAGRVALLDALAICPRVRVPLVALGAVLCEPLATLYAGSVEDEDRRAIGEVMSAVYGAQPAVASVLRRHPVGRHPVGRQPVGR